MRVFMTDMCFHDDEIPVAANKIRPIQHVLQYITANPIIVMKLAASMHLLYPPTYCV